MVLLDVCLPDGSGLEQIHAIKAEPCLPEIIVITGLGDEEGAEHAVRSGVWDYWQKGRSIKDLVLSLGRALAWRSERLAHRHWRTLDLQGLWGKSQAMATCFERIAEASVGDVPVLLLGETGTGKEVVARAIHKNSVRARKPFVVVDCAALTETLVESALFGHDKGAFTGASADRVGLVRQAHEGTLFLDEIGELSGSVQKTFLRVLQEKRVRPVGADREMSSDFRLLAATNRDLKRMVADGTFRDDLYFRLRALEIALPPLRTRADDVLRIAEQIAHETCERLVLPAKSLSPDFSSALTLYPWPGNVRELRQAVECAVVTAGHACTLDPIHLPIQIRIELARSAVKPELNLSRIRNYSGCCTLAAARDTAIASYLSRLIADTEGDIDAACEVADVSRSRLYELLKLHGVPRASPGKKSDTVARAFSLRCS